ncbi:hypothetical protein [Streptomyces sp. MST-110588]|uniref:hypothetical protein n=1 Tax=Streptomyces sp. MST-110588 TaxID=2833628 RepID=UPI001F5CB5B7|nr:hypothetical protein [Streptomyces sp. MST-110588]UNO43279.1 hypothetical protein KGS77_32075 [Streptomyces sp. MST-110588]
MAGTGGAAQGYEADPDVLKKAGGRALDIRQDLLDAAEPTCAATRRAATGVDGWRSEDQLRKTAALWEKQNFTLAEQMGRTGANLQYNATNYQSAEAVNAAGMKPGDSPWG